MEACNFWLNVTNDQLLASVYVTLLFIIVLACAIGINTYRLIMKNRPLKGKLVSILMILGGIIGISLSYPHYKVEDALLNNYQYITGTTTGFCDVPLRGEGISYNYEWNGKLYYGCRTFHPIERNQIIANGGKYQVRFTSDFPEEGRMDFSSPLP